MDEFLRRKNVEHFRLLVEEIIADERDLERNLKLLREERQKRQGDKVPHPARDADEVVE